MWYASLEMWVNRLFIVSLLLLSAGGSLFVLQGGMFNGIIFGFKRFFHRMSKVGEYTREFDPQSDLVEPFHFSATVPLLFSGGILFLLTLVVSFIL